MCGIAGYIGKAEIEKAPILRTLELMKNRGPDHQDYVAFRDGDLHVALLHSRLTIIDEDDRSNQPFTIGDSTLIFNGEIYNYIELRDRLKKEAIRFRTESDTEVLLHAYLSWGERCVEEFEGMWSFAIYDRKQRKLLLSRDRFREKPLYVFETPDGIYFGSEVKFIKSLLGFNLTVNMRQVFRYLVNGYKSLYKTEETFFVGIREVPNASNAIIDHDLRLKSYRYWNPVYAPREMSLNDAIEGFRERLLESIKIRLRADVPIAFCLSGGVDSSAIVSIASKLFHYEVATFSIIDHDERYNEYHNIQATLADIQCKHEIIEVPKKQTFERLHRLVAYHDAPLYTITFFVHSLLLEAISKSCYRVAVSGIGADEMISGYHDHFNLHLYEMRTRADYQRYLDDWNAHTRHFVRNPFLKNPELYFNAPDFREHIYLNNDIFSSFLKVGFKEPFTEETYSDSLMRNRMLNELFHEAVPVALHDDDLNSMFYSVENRSPYLDSRLFEFSYSIPSEYLILDGYGKYPLREAVRGILNETVRSDRRKRGFNASINSLIDFKDKKNRDSILSEGKIYDFVDREKIEPLLIKSPMPNSFSKFLFNMINAKIFLELNP